MLVFRQIHLTVMKFFSSLNTWRIISSPWSPSRRSFSSTSDLHTLPYSISLTHTFPPFPNAIKNHGKVVDYIIGNTSVIWGVYIIFAGGVETWGILSFGANFEATIWIANPWGAMCKRNGTHSRCFVNFYAKTYQWRWLMFPSTSLKARNLITCNPSHGKIHPLARRFRR